MDKIKENIPFILLLVVMGLFIFAFIVSETSLFKTEEISTYTFDELVNLQVNNDTVDLVLTDEGANKASENDIRAAMNVQNSHDLQFLILNSKSGASEDELNQLLENKGVFENMGASFLKAERMHRVNALYLLSHAFLETGHGQSELASGIEIENTTYYNFFGIGAFDHAAIEEGSSYAEQAEWSTPEAAIIGGAEFIRLNYLEQNQDTLYRMRWNPDNPGMHLYATDIEWAEKIAVIMDEQYAALDLEPGEFKFENYEEK